MGCILPPLRGSVVRCLAQSAGSFCGAQDSRLGTQDSLQDWGLATRDSLRDSLQRAIPLRFRHIHRQQFQAVTLGIFYESGGRIEAHGLIVQQGCGESGQVVAFQIGAGIRDQGETRGVGFGKSIERE